MSSRPPAGWFQAPMLSRFTVPPLRRIVRSAPPAAAFGHVELVAVRVPAEVGQRVEQQDPRVRPEAVLVELRRREAARAGADDHAVVALVAAVADDGTCTPGPPSLLCRAAASTSGRPSIL